PIFRLCHPGVERASRVLAKTSRLRGLFQRLFRRDAETKARDARATRQPALPQINRSACPSNSTAKGADTRNIATNRQGMDIVSAFVGRDGLKIHKMPDHGIAVGNADGAK